MGGLNLSRREAALASLRINIRMLDARHTRRQWPFVEVLYEFLEGFVAALRLANDRSVRRIPDKASDADTFRLFDGKFTEVDTLDFATNFVGYSLVCHSRCGG